MNTTPTVQQVPGEGGINNVIDEKEGKKLASLNEQHITLEQYNTLYMLYNVIFIGHDVFLSFQILLIQDNYRDLSRN